MIAMLIALLVDAALGWPARLYERIGHPVTWIGALIQRLDTRLNRETDSAGKRRAMGRVTVIAVLAAAAIPAWLVQSLLPGGWIGAVLTGLLAWPLIAARSLHDHVTAVARPLVAGDMTGARDAVAMIVGRDPDRLDAAGIARAAIESLAENASDGVVAPVFWGVIFGLPGIAAYKALNTMDSMIGHRTERHTDFGRAAARLDDLANWAPARLTGALLVVVSPEPEETWDTMRLDAPDHRSPNAGWPEAAMARALDVRLSGPRSYAEGTADEPWLNGRAPDPEPGAIDRALGLYRRAMGLMAALLLAFAVIL